MKLWEHFDKNEWFIIVMIITSTFIIYKLPKRLPTSILIISLTWGFAASLFWDFTIGGGVFNYYKVNDSEQYCLFDLFSYLMFAPFGYLFIYFYETLCITSRTLIFYILSWTVISVVLEWVSVIFGVFQYENGYKIIYSIPIYLTTQTITALYYELLKRKSKF
ncbi:MAG: hypothetical protein Q8936_23120 [Bacillota bacterium]|nr:hypothetical protein [Bacillota bacterium]